MLGNFKDAFNDEKDAILTFRSLLFFHQQRRCYQRHFPPSRLQQNVKIEKLRWSGGVRGLRWNPFDHRSASISHKVNFKRQFHVCASCCDVICKLLTPKDDNGKERSRAERWNLLINDWKCFMCRPRLRFFRENIFRRIFTLLVFLLLHLLSSPTPALTLGALAFLLFSSLMEKHLI